MIWYVQGDKLDISTWKLSQRNHKNSKTVGAAPLDENGNPEDPEWLQLEFIGQGEGTFVEILTVNQPLKEQVQQQRFEEEQAAQESQEQIDNDKQAKKDKIKNLKSQQINGLADIKQVLIDIRDLLESEGII